ncbi:MAG: ABC transporter ATP-binding protein [Clostridiales bacterium]|nr:ABC transporter ATP-binding protein [Clostridiales bacterium]
MSMKIEVRDVVKRFDDVCALDGFCMSVPAGAVYGLVGPNGAGKSTIIRHLSGVYRQDSGEVLIGGQKVFENTALKERVICIPDELYFFLQATVKDMMRFYRGIYPRFDGARFERLAEMFDLDPKRPIRRFSKGMQKQAAFWLAMSLRPDVLILDEPVDGLDPVMRRRVWQVILSDVRERGTTVLVSSHNLRELEDVCDHIGIINKGKLLLERALTDMQGSVSKLQILMEEGAALPEGLDILQCGSAGRVQTLIVRGTAEEVSARAQAANPLYFEFLPMTLEEIFIYELGGADHEAGKIVL